MSAPDTPRLFVRHTHLYPGARGRIEAAGDGACLVEFSDGTVAGAELSGDRLIVAPHRTAAGTAIPEKTWRLSVDGGAFRVAARA